MKTKLIAIIFVLICCYVNLIVGLVLKNDADAQLLRRSKEMLSFMNESVDPCEDFYEFACGKWPHAETSYMKKVIQAHDEKILEMLKDKQNPNDLQFDKKVKSFFQSCVSLNESVYAEKMRKVVEEIGKMPALEQDDEEWNENTFDWLDTLARIVAKYGFQILIGVEVEPDVKDNSINRVTIGRAEFELKSKAIYLEPVGEKYREVYPFVIASKLNELLEIDFLTALSTSERIFDFETKLAKGLVDSKSDISLDKLYVQTTVEELQGKYGPTIDVKRFLKTILGEASEGIIYEHVPGYLQNVKDVIEKADKRDVADFIFYQLVQRFHIDSETSEKLEKSCLDLVKKQFHKAIDNMFYRRFLDKQIEFEIRELWSKIKDSFKARLMSTEAIDWLTAETRSKALEKLEAQQIFINSYEDYDFEKDFVNLAISEEDFVANLLNKIQFETNKSFRKLHEPVSNAESVYIASGTAVNHQNKNRVIVSMPMLQPYVLWASNFPDALKFSLAGVLLGHELIHGFDDTGRHFDKSGNLAEWWDSESSKRFVERRNCFIEQYHIYVFGDIQLPKSEKQSENIADNGGLKLAYDAFVLHSDDTEQKVLHGLPDFQYSDEQLFFIAYGQIWCSDSDGFFNQFKTAADDHTPEKFRSIGTVSNSVEFAKAFNCTVGSKMNPEKKCKLY